VPSAGASPSPSRRATRRRQAGERHSDTLPVLVARLTCRPQDESEPSRGHSRQLSLQPTSALADAAVQHHRPPLGWLCRAAYEAAPEMIGAARSSLRGVHTRHDRGRPDVRRRSQPAP
jgi:hypothetical protein